MDASNHITTETVNSNLRTLEMLSVSFPNAASAASEIINLEAILTLPKGTEHFVADLHGEYEAFSHILRNASGNIKRKVSALFADTLTDDEIRNLCTLIYYPAQKLEQILEPLDDAEPFYKLTIPRLIDVCRTVSSKYTRSKVRKALPKTFSYIIEELLHESQDDRDKKKYFEGIVNTIISTGQAHQFVIELCNVIQKLSIDYLHILGDVFDRGPGAHLIMDRLCQYANFDFQWGNHDILWMGACAGNDACIANAMRLCLRFGNIDTLEDGYGINLLPLATFALNCYANDPCEAFKPTFCDNNKNKINKDLLAKMHKAIVVIQFKLEASLIDKYPEWGMADRKLLDKIDQQRGVITLEGKEYQLKDSNFPTIDPANPFALTKEEQELVTQLHHSFRVSEKLLRHIKCILSHGCMYAITNSNLLFHASIPLNDDGTLKEVEVNGVKYKGKDLLHNIGMLLRNAYSEDASRAQRHYARDYYWYMWCGPDSPLFDKSRMATFERYLIEDKDTHAEEKGAYYRLRNDPKIIEYILDEFGVKGNHRHIINGHVPVRLIKGESPIMADGKLMVIDGGFAKAYHSTTGSAGYTLVYHSRGFQLVKHEPFTSQEDAISSGTDIISATEIIELNRRRIRVKDTDKGEQLRSQIEELSQLLFAYRHGIIKERFPAM